MWDQNQTCLLHWLADSLLTWSHQEARQIFWNSFASFQAQILGCLTCVTRTYHVSLNDLLIHEEGSRVAEGYSWLSGKEWGAQWENTQVVALSWEQAWGGQTTKSSCVWPSVVYVVTWYFCLMAQWACSKMNLRKLHSMKDEEETQQLFLPGKYSS